ncbi:hypothetical protein [Pseudoteredinibacter isoporae]|uniref:Uncharacterized protein n=1 Tax=Pseudoteredinibacter isoporae TaxID=570281 RepID=A0A7X0JRR2_9GAMM|nr:hypothetical protein [Pseudoteredinibacter isoporae]MBB6521075.1 hypothetical protein [Pseudoteredinibacter isoporae]NHO86639.1 hypothetical protein [Pseudoteredinibacter isoporae]NIB24909.1 hypothetical protein [Pseudoteredinibacter isoporae]
MSLPPIPKLSAFLLGAFITVLILSWANQNQLQQQQAELNQHYGEVLARKLAQQAENPTMTRDWVSLQVLAENTKSEKGIASVTFHSVDNKLLAQAGKTARQKGADKAQQSFSAPINLQDSVAGYVTIGLNSSELSQQPQAYGLQLFALLLLAAALINMYLDPQRTATDNRHVRKHDTDINGEPENDAHSNAPICAWLVIQSGNLASLQKQLSAAALQELLDEFNQQLQTVLNLYQGELLWVDGDSFHCGFRQPSRDDNDQGIFNAICSTKLLVDLGRSRQGIKLHFKAAILPPAEGDSYSELFAAYRDSQQQRSQLDALDHASLLLDKRLLEDRHVLEQLEFSEDQHNVYVDAIKAPYLDLLKEQLRHLRGQHI